MNDLILHSYRRCPFAIRVRMVLEEKNLPFTVIEEDLSAPSPELLRLHPEGKVPLLIHKGMAIHESAIITEYLEDSFPSPALRTDSALGKAELRLWTYWCNELFKPDLDLYKYRWASLSEGEQAALRIRLQAHLQKMEIALAGKPFIAGNAFTLTDIHLFPFYRQLQKSRPDFSAQFSVQMLNDWLERITARPAFDRVMRKG